MGGFLVAVVYVFVFYYFFVGPTGFRWRAIYGDVTFPEGEGFEIQGIDISHYQGTIDWEALRNAMIQKAPVRFVIIKATEGATMIDENFADNFYQAREYGFIRGAYHFYSTKSPARQQAYHFLDKVKLEPGDLPPVLDVEHKNPEQTTEEFQQDVLSWLHIVEDRYHVKPILYTSYRFKQKYLSDSIFDAYPYWIAHYYVDAVRYEGPWLFWQHTDVGSLPGIRHEVDLNVFRGSREQLQQLTLR